jgi:hypothetical protein
VDDLAGSLGAEHLHCGDDPILGALIEAAIPPLELGRELYFPTHAGSIKTF